MIPVLVSGIGLVNSLGLDVDETVRGLRAGKTGLRPVVHHPWLPAGCVAAEIPTRVEPETRPLWIMKQALNEALEDARLGAADIEEAGVFAGTTSGFMEFDDLETWRAMQRGGREPRGLRCRGVGELASRVAAACGSRGPRKTFFTACTSSALALIEAWRMIRTGRLRHAVVVGYETLLYVTAQGFRTLMLHDDEGCRPFDRNRRGMTLGEGCGVLVLSAGDAGSCGRHRTRIAAGVSILDCTSPTSHARDGSFGQAMLCRLLDEARVSMADVRAIKIHGTGTQDNDFAESRAIAAFLRARQGPAAIPLFGMKGSLGHTLGASGVVELAAWIGCLGQGFLPGTVGFSEPDPDLGFQPETAETPAVPGIHVCQCFGFGGSCAAIALEYGGSA